MTTEPLDRPIVVNSFRNSPLAVLVDKLQTNKEYNNLFTTSMDCDYYLASAHFHYKNISDYYCKALDHAKQFYEQNKKRGTEHNQFGNPSEYAYFIYMEFDAYLNAVRITQNKLISMIRHKYKQEISASMNDFIKKPKNDVFYNMIKEYRESSGKSLKDMRDNLNHHQRMSPAPIGGVNIEKNTIEFKIPSNPECKSRNGIRYNGPDMIKFIEQSLYEIQEITLKIASNL